MREHEHLGGLRCALLCQLSRPYASPIELAAHRLGAVVKTWYPPLLRRARLTVRDQVDTLPWVEPASAGHVELHHGLTEWLGCLDPMEFVFLGQVITHAGWLTQAQHAAAQTTRRAARTGSLSVLCDSQVHMFL